CETAIAMFGDDVLDDRTGLGEDQITIGDQRRGAERMERLVFGRREPGDGIALVKLQFVRDAKFLTEPNDPLGLRFAQVMDRQHTELPGQRSRPWPYSARAGR